MCKRDHAKSISLQAVNLKLPQDLCKWKGNRTVSIDSCIVDQIKVLWNAKIETLGCCCGHDKPKLGGISLIIDCKYSDDEIKSIAALLKQSDTRNWHILQWREHKLQEVEQTQFSAK